MEHGSEDEEMEFGGFGENKPLLAGVCRDEGKERRSMLAGCCSSLLGELVSTSNWRGCRFF